MGRLEVALKRIAELEATLEARDRVFPTRVDELEIEVSELKNDLEELGGVYQLAADAYDLMYEQDHLNPNFRESDRERYAEISEELVGQHLPDLTGAILLALRHPYVV